MTDWFLGLQLGGQGCLPYSELLERQVEIHSQAGCEKLNLAKTAPKGAIENERLTARLKPCPDTNHSFIRSLLV